MQQAQEGGGSKGGLGGTSGKARPQAEMDGTEIPCVRLLVPAGSGTAALTDATIQLRGIQIKVKRDKAMVRK